MHSLTPEQVRFFETFGYLVQRELFSPEEVAWITEEFEKAIQGAGGQEHDGSQRTMFLGPIDRTERLCTLLDDPRILALAGGILGEDFNYASGDGNYYTGDTAWHPDGSWGQLFACKIAFYLDPVGKDTGCLRVIPGSQRPEHPLRTSGIDPNRSMELFGVEPREFPGSLALETKPGDVVMFNHDLYHASFGGSQRRRMFTMNLTRGGETEEDTALVRQYVSVHSPGGYKVKLGAGMYSPIMLDTASPGRMTHLAQCARLHDQLFPDLRRNGA